MKELFILISKIKKPIIKYSYQFSDGTDMGVFISLYRKKISKGDCTKLENWLFHKYLTLEEKIDRDNFIKKATEAMYATVELERFPVTSGPNKNQSLVRSFSDKKDIGSFIYRILSKLKEHELPSDREKLISEFLNVDFNEIKRWNQGYRYAEEYFARYGNINIASSYHTEDGFELGDFMQSNIALYYSDDKDLLTTVHEDMLSRLDSNWMGIKLSELPPNREVKRQSGNVYINKREKQKRLSS